MKSIVPPYLRHGEGLRVVSSAGAVTSRDLDAGMSGIRCPFQLVIPAEVFSVCGYLAGTDALRQTDFQRALTEPGCRGLMASRGGFGTTRILDHLDFTSFVENPRWIVGSSDLTALLVYLWYRYRMLTLHGPMALRLNNSPQDTEAMFQRLSGVGPSHPCTLRGWVSGRVHAPLVGGNLTVLAHLVGTLPSDFAQGCILFLEDVNEQPYRIDRSIVQLKRAGILNVVAGVVLGEFTGCDPADDGVTVDEVLRFHFGSLSVPIATGYPAAHGTRNRPFVHGGRVVLQVESEAAFLDDRQVFSVR